MLLLIMCCNLEVADCRMTPAIKLIFAQAFVAGPPSLVDQLMGNGVLHRGPFAQRGSSPLCLHLGPQLLLERLVLADAQASALPTRGFVHWGRKAHTSHAAAGNWAGLPRLMGTLWPPGQVTCIPAKSKVNSCFVNSGPTCGQGRAIMSTPCSAHWAIRGLAMYPRSISSCSRPGAFSNAAASSATASCSGSLAGRITTSRMTLLSKSTAKCSLKPLKVFALLLRPWRMSLSSIEMRRSGATWCLRRRPPGPPPGAGSVSWAIICVMVSRTSFSGGCSAASVCCCASQRCHRALPPAPGPGRIPVPWAPPNPDPGPL